MTWDYKRDFEFLANVVKMQDTLYFLVGGTFYSEASVNHPSYLTAIVFKLF